MQPQNTVTHFDELLAKSAVVFVVFYRGHWCPFCIAYLKSLQKISNSIKAQNGAILVVTAENESELAATQTASGYQGEIVVDTENLLATELKGRGMLDVAITEKKGYEHGMAQPAVLAVRGAAGKEDGSQGEVLYRWAIVPGLMNLGGAKDRPDLQQVWENVYAKLKGNNAVHHRIKTQTIFGTVMGKVFG